MSRYTTLWKHAQTYFQKDDDFSLRGKRAAADALLGLARYLEAPQERIRFGPPDAKLTDDEGWTAVGAIRDEGEDGWFGGCLLLHSESSPRSVLKFVISARPDHEKIAFRTLGNAPIHYAASVADAEMQAFYERIFNVSVEIFQSTPEDVHAGRLASRPIGFLAKIG